MIATFCFDMPKKTDTCVVCGRMPAQGTTVEWPFLNGKPLCLQCWMYFCDSIVPPESET